MNDLDLRVALQRDADLVGEPSPDLLDQLVDRRRLQRRQRSALLGAVAAVVIIAAGIPIASSLVTRSEGGPATRTETPTIAPTPSVTPEDVQETPQAPTTPEPEVEDPAPTGDSPAAPAWPSASAATHGGQYWAVFLEVAREGTEQAELQRAYADASALGYPSGIGDVNCSQGAREQLGLDPTVSYQVVNIYFDTSEQAQQFVDLYESGVVGTAYVTAYCLD